MKANRGCASYFPVTHLAAGRSLPLALMYGLLILMSLPVGNFTILRFHRGLCVLRVHRCLTGSLATGSTLRLRAAKRKRRIISLVATSASVSFVKISQYATVTIDFSEYFHHSYRTPLLEQVTRPTAPQGSLWFAAILQIKTYVTIEEIFSKVLCAIFAMISKITFYRMSGKNLYFREMCIFYLYIDKVNCETISL